MDELGEAVLTAGSVDSYDPGAIPPEGELWVKLASDERVVRFTLVQRINGDSVLGVSLRAFPMPKVLTFTGSSRQLVLLHALRVLHLSTPDPAAEVS